MIVLGLVVGCDGVVDVSPGSGGANTTGTGGMASSTTGGIGGTSSTTASTSTSSSAGTGGTGGGVFIPACTASEGTLLAVDTLFLGDKTPGGNISPAAWKQYGFNVDGKVSTATSTDLCKPIAGASKTKVYPDGDNGIDNSFGKNVVPAIVALQPTFSSQVNYNIYDGSFTLMIDFVGLKAGADQDPVVGKLYAGANLGMSPYFDGNDCWPVRPEGLTSTADIKSSKIVFPAGKLVGNLWQSGIVPTLTLAFDSPVGTLSLTIHNAQVSVQLNPDHKSGATGNIGGVLDTVEFTKEINKAIGTLNPLFCGQFDSTIQGASDILNDGTQDPTKDCNGISVGLGFTMKSVQFGGVAPATSPGTSSCP